MELLPCRAVQLTRVAQAGLTYSSPYSPCTPLSIHWLRLDDGLALPVAGESRCETNWGSTASQILDKIHPRIHVSVEDHRIEDLVHWQPVQRIIVRRAELQGCVTSPEFAFL